MNNKILKTLSLSVISLASIFSLGYIVSSKNDSKLLNTVKAEATASTKLINGFENTKDLYRIKPVALNPTDTLKVSINNDKNYIKSGNGSLKYEFVNGKSHQFLQYIANSDYPDTDVRTLKSVSLDVYNANNKDYKVTLSTTTYGGAVLCSLQQVVKANAWTTIKYDELVEFSYKKKANMGGIAFRFDVDQSATFYVDNLQIEDGAPDLPPVDLTAFVNSLESTKPSVAVTKDTLEANLKFVSDVNYALSIYEALADKTSVSAVKAKLDELVELCGPFRYCFSAKDDERSIDKWYYGSGLTVSQDDDNTYGSIFNIAIDTGSGREQSLKFDNLDVSTFSSIVFFVYNPLNTKIKMNLNGGWKDWSFQSVELKPNAWTKVEILSTWIERDIKGSVFPILYGESSISGVLKFTSMYGVLATEGATDIINRIDELKSEDLLTLDDKDVVNNLYNDYNDLSTAVKTLVTNYQKLTKAVTKINQLEADSYDLLITNLVNQTVTDDNAAECYINAISLESEIAALSNNVYDKMNNVNQLDDLITSFNSRMFNITTKLINDLKEPIECEFPKDIKQVNIAKTCYDSLTTTEKTNLGDLQTKLQNLIKETNKYILLFDPVEYGTDVITIVEDFGCSWDGSMNTAVDETYGPIVEFNVKSGHAIATREAEFKLCLYDEIWNYESIVLYVNCPLESGGCFRVYKSNWLACNDISLTKGWNKVVIDSSYFSDNNLHGCFFIFNGPTSPKGLWQVSSFYAYYDEEQVRTRLNTFKSLVEAIPTTIDLNAEEAIVQARLAYDSLKEFEKLAVNQTVLRKLTTAEANLATFKRDIVKNTFIQKVNNLNESSTALEVYELDYQLYNMDKALYNSISSDVITKLQQFVKTNATGIAQIIDNKIIELCTDISFPRDLIKFNAYYDYVYATIDEVFDILTNKSYMKENRTISRGYGVVYSLDNDFVSVDLNPIEDENYGTLYECTLRRGSAYMNLAKLDKGIAGAYSKIVIEVYRPNGGCTGRLYCSVDGPTWEDPSSANFMITNDGWTRIEIDVNVLKNISCDDYIYFYIYDDSFSSDSQIGWMITNIYGCK